jgi:membrane-associated phospholipid phosphatase
MVSFHFIPKKYHSYRLDICLKPSKYQFIFLRINLNILKNMKRKIYSLLAILLIANYLQAQVEPNSRPMKTWFIASIDPYRLPAPKTDKSEINTILAIQKNLNDSDFQKIQHWQVGSPSFRWQNLINKIWQSDAMNNGILANLLVSVSVYDATVVAYESKIAYNRLRPFQKDKRIKAIGVKSELPAYPCEYSVSAGAAATIIAHFFPKMADSVNNMAQEVMQTRIAAGMAYPSDTKAGFELGKKIALAEIIATKGYLNNTPWDGNRPERKLLWNGKFALFANAGKSKTVALETASQYRPGPPPASWQAEMDELKNYKQSQKSMANALFFDNQSYWDDLLDKLIFEHNYHLNPLLASQIYAIAAIGYYDAFVACFDAKYTYWGIRPEQFDPTFKPLLFASPPFPGYPSGHAAVSSTLANLYAYYFPKQRIFLLKKANDVAESRFQGGIHFRTDNVVATDLGIKVALEILKKAELK